MLLHSGHIINEADCVLVGKLVRPIINRSRLLQSHLYFEHAAYTTATVKLNTAAPLLLLAVVRSTTSISVWYKFMDCNGNVAWEWYGGLMPVTELLRPV